MEQRPFHRVPCPASLQVVPPGGLDGFGGLGWPSQPLSFAGCFHNQKRSGLDFSAKEEEGPVRRGESQVGVGRGTSPRPHYERNKYR